MKTHYTITRRIWLQVALCFITYHVQGQELAFKVSYDASEFTYYQNHEADHALLTTQDSIKMAPTWTLIHHSEVYYTDSTYVGTQEFSYPLGQLEQWMDPVSKVVITPVTMTVTTQDKTHVFEHEDGKSLPNPKEIAPFYLASDYWQLPFDEYTLELYLDEGYKVLQNTDKTFVAKSPSDVVILDKTTWTETLIELDPEGDELLRHSKHYATNDDGYLLLDYEEIHKLDRAYRPCMEFIKLIQYSNIKREYSKSYAPTNENGVYFAMTPTPSISTIKINTDLSQSQLVVVFQEADPKSLDIAVLDSYGNVVLEAKHVTRENPNVDITSLGLGIYTFKVTNYNYQPIKFISN